MLNIVVNSLSQQFLTMNVSYPHLISDQTLPIPNYQYQKPYVRFFEKKSIAHMIGDILENPTLKVHGQDV